MFVGRQEELEQIKEIKEIPVERVGFVSLSGFSFKKRLYDLVPAEALYKIRELGTENLEMSD
jgi:hypothetical protein